MVTADDKVPDDADDDDPEDNMQDDDDNQPTPTSSPKPEHGLPAPGGNMSGGTPFIGELPVRSNPYSQSSIMQPDINASTPGYVEGNSMGVSSQPSMSQTHSMSLSEPYTDPHAASRRPSMFNSPSEYGGSSSSAMYQNWQQSTPSTASSVYSFQHTQQQQPHSTESYVDQQQHVPLAHTPQYLEAPTYVSMHNGPPSLYRSTGMAQGPIPALSFPNYHSTHGSASLPRPHDENDHKRWNP